MISLINHQRFVVFFNPPLFLLKSQLPAAESFPALVMMQRWRAEEDAGLTKPSRITDRWKKNLYLVFVKLFVWKGSGCVV